MLNAAPALDEAEDVERLRAHAAMIRAWLRRPPPVWVGDWAETWAAVWRGEEPAESLPSAVRAALFRSLRADGWTDQTISAWTRTTTTVIERMIGRG